MTMYKQTAATLRQLFLNYFVKNAHTLVRSSPLIPANDPTLMFVNSGMVQFKDVFTGREKRDYTRATTCQKCLRVSGKHNDLEEVGRTTRHNTLFEMLGNFSFGDYFKEEAITLAWNFLTKEVGLNQQKLWVTYFGGENDIAADHEAKDLWTKISGMPQERIIAKGIKDNFWSMGDTGPCGPCSEIYFDMGGESSPTAADFESGRITEIWNNVFMQFERAAAGGLTALPRPCVDTGMGLERLCSVVNGTDSIFHTDVFMPLIDLTSAQAKKNYRQSEGEDDVSMRVIADHARATAFLIADGIQPSNEGRGYVLRRIMRRAIRHGHRLGLKDLFFHEICLEVIKQMGTVYKELHEARVLLEKVVVLEEQGFRRTLDVGLNLLNDAFDSVKSGSTSVLSGDIIFKLYDTFGFPKDLTEILAQEQNIQLDDLGFDKALQEQKERSRGHSGDAGDRAIDYVYKSLLADQGPVQFVGYSHEELPVENKPGKWRIVEFQGNNYLQIQTHVKACLQNGQAVQSTHSGDVEIVLDPTPFYGESGGQVGDSGLIQADNNLVVIVDDTKKPLEGLQVCIGRLQSGSLGVSQHVWAGYNISQRQQTRAHHSATHLLHKALRDCLGDHIKQAGSLVDAVHLRFDYAHFNAPKTSELRTIEKNVQQMVEATSHVDTETLPFEQAKQKGAIALFGEKYGDTVRVVSMGPSLEFCGGTHVNNTKDIEMLLITREEAVASGVRRIEATVKSAARAWINQLQQQLAIIAEILAQKRTSLDSIKLDSQGIIAGVFKTVEQYQGTKGNLEKNQAVAKTVAFDPHMAETFLETTAKPNYGQCQNLRDQWLQLVQLMNLKPTDPSQITAMLQDTTDPGNILETLTDYFIVQKDNEKLLQQTKKQQLTTNLEVYLQQKQLVHNIPLLAHSLENIEGNDLRTLADALRQKIGSGIVLLLSKINDTKVALLVAVTNDLSKQFHAGKLVQTLAPLIDGRGGGKPDLAQAGGSKITGIPDVLEQIKLEIENVTNTSRP